MANQVRVSVILPACNAELWIARAVRSALGQSETAVEVLAVENGSTDGTWELLQALAARDPRLRPLRAGGAVGPSAARNMGLEAARGEWIAVLDADDCWTGDRLEILLAEAEAAGASIIADNQALVDEDDTPLGIMWPLAGPSWIDAPEFVRRNAWGRERWGLGYAKPVILREVVEAAGLRYDTTLRIGEDFHFLLALLAQGERMRLLPDPLYRYTIRQGSLTKTLSEADLDGLLAAARRAEAAARSFPLRRELAGHIRALERMRAHVRVVAELKSRRPHRAAAVLAATPSALPVVAKYGWEAVAKRLSARPPASSEARSVAYFGQNSRDNAVIRRIHSFREAGLAVLGLTFHRQTVNRDFQPDWDNVDLGETRDRDYRGRLFSLLGALPAIARNRHDLGRASLFYARNIDMAVLALAARAISGSRAPLVYEVLDVQRAFLGTGLAARALRWAERQVLARARLLAVSSPGFMEHYFRPVQQYGGDWFLLENKILGPQLREMVAARPKPSPPELLDRRGDRIVIGWHGTLRCVRSLEMLAGIARALPDKVLVYMRGYPTETGLDPFLDVVRRHPNMVYGGEFFSPRDLPEIYGDCDLAWCFDYLDAGTNSDWLLPNRLYDGCFFNVPVLALGGTETGRMVERLDLGWTFPEPALPALIRFLGEVSPKEIAHKRAHIATLPRSHFCDEGDVARLLVAAGLRPSNPAPTEAGQAPLSSSRNAAE